MEDASDDEEESDDAEPAEEEVREKRRQSKRKSASGKPAAKRTKPNGTAAGGTVDLAIRPAGGQKSRKVPAKRRAAQDAAAEQAGGIYGNSTRC